jgi:hypothetical protein
MGTVFFGALLMIFLRKGKSGNRLLSMTGWILLFSTILFGFLIPIVNIFWLPISFLSILFTTATGIAIGIALILSGRFFSKPVAEFALAFLAIQCILNGFGDIMFLMELHAPTMNVAGGIDPSAIGDVASGVGDAEIGSSAGEVGVPHSDALKYAEHHRNPRDGLVDQMDGDLDHPRGLRIALLQKKPGVKHESGKSWKVWKV